MKYLTSPSIALAFAVLANSAFAASNLPGQEEMWEVIQDQQQQIDELTSGSSASSAGNTQIGGYGELHYNNLDSKKEIDFHRFVLFFGHQFSDKFRMFSELELEHAIGGEGKVGEIELEQAYIEYDIAENHRAKAGLFLIPVGIINETHEPPTFYGTERNPVEKNIIPATWWAGGIAAQGEIAEALSYDVAIHEGLNTTAANSYKPRSGRQKTGKAKAEDLAATARVKWTGVAGVELAATVQYQTDITQSNDASAGDAWLYELHASINKGPFGLRSLYARWDLEGTGPAAIGADEQTGFYIEPSFKVTEKFGVFARYNQYDNQAGNGSDSEKIQYDAGINFWPHPDIVLKADIQSQDNEGAKNDNGFNLGVGYQF